MTLGSSFGRRLPLEKRRESAPEKKALNPKKGYHSPFT
jgi:hypothetical protein